MSDDEFYDDEFGTTVGGPNCDHPSATGVPSVVPGVAPVMMRCDGCGAIWPTVLDAPSGSGDTP